MKKNFTLLYLLNNFDDNENELINFDEFQDVNNTLETNILKPKESVVNNILNFSKAYKRIQLKSFDDVDMIIN